MMRKKVCRVIVMVGCGVLGYVATCQAQNQLVCGDYTNDSAALKQAPRGARRVSRHLLTVNFQGGRKRFMDQKPYAEAFGGAHWYYCGYLPALRAHLIGKNQNSLFSGMLLLDDTGQLITAGAAVYAAPDGKQFLATRQEDGEDGAEWRVADRSGKTVWDGYAGILKQVSMPPASEPMSNSMSEPMSTVVAQFDAPQWSRDGVLHAIAICADASDVKSPASFEFNHGAWSWRTHLKCGS